MSSYKADYNYVKSKGTAQLLSDVKMLMRIGNNNVNRRVHCAVRLSVLKDVLIERKTDSIINKHHNVEFMEQRIKVITQGIDRCINTLKKWVVK